MSRSGASGDINIWSCSNPATTATVVYRYSDRAFAPDGTVVEAPGVPAYTFLLEPKLGQGRTVAAATRATPPA